MNRRTPAGSAALVAVAAGLASLLAGCVSIPSSGPVVEARKVEGGRGGVIQILPAGPVPGSSPRGLVRDFLRAAAAFANDHEVARSFVVPDQRLSWLPDSPVVIYPSEEALTFAVTRDGVPVPDPIPMASTAAGTAPASAGPVAPRATARSPHPSSSTGPPGPAGLPSAGLPSAGLPSAGLPSAGLPSAGPSVSAPPRVGEVARVTVTAPVQARVDSSGQYTVSPPGDVEIRHFDLVGTDQGWRVRSLENGIMVTRYDFSITFRDLPLYFADSTATYLVPDIRWFPISGTTSTPSSLVAAMLAVPSSWLHPAVISGAPPGTQLTINAVKVADGVATVDLTAAVRTADGRERQMLHAQLEQTLLTLAQLAIPVSSVVITVEQQRFELQPAAAASLAPRVQQEPAVRLRPSPSVDARPVVIDAHGAVARLVGRSVVPVPGLAALSLASAVAPAVDAGSQNYAVLVDGRTRLLSAVPSGRAVPLITGRDLVAPSFDPFGWVWSAQADSGGVVYAARPQVEVAKVAAPWLIGARILSMRISREGARALVVVDRRGSGPEVYVSAVVRDGQGRPSELATPLRLISDATQAGAASWVDESHVVVLARRPGSVEQPWVVEVGGDARPTLPVQGTLITAGNSEFDLYVQSATGVVRTRLGSGWSDIPGVRWPAMPG